MNRKDNYDKYFINFTLVMLVLTLASSFLVGLNRYFNFMSGFFAGLTFVLVGYIVICLLLDRELIPIKIKSFSRNRRHY